jgi:hypothetical protein
MFAKNTLIFVLNTNNESDCQTTLIVNNSS